MLKISKTDKIMYISLAVWILITALRIVFHQPWYDEAHAYMMSQQLSLIDIIAQMKYEGHTFIWYLLMMPFAKADLWYPYPMLILNWLFMFCAMIIFWKKAPFHPITKIIISFSYPFLAQLPVIARCYTIGVLFMFILTDLYFNKLKCPLVYSTCLIICANTSVMALFSATAFGIIFVIDMIKGALDGIVSRKDFRISFSILALGAVLILWQLGGANSSFIGQNTTFLKNFSEFLLGTNLITNIITLAGMIFAVIIFPVYCWRNKKIFFILIFQIAMILYCFITQWGGCGHHFIFFWIYPLVAIWLMHLIDEKSKLSVIAEIVLAVMFFGQIFTHMNNSPNNFYSGSRYMAETFINDNVAENGRVIIFIEADKRFVPYVKNKNAEIYFYGTAEKVDWDSYVDNSQLTGYAKVVLVPTWIHKSMSKTRQNFALLMITKERPADGFVIEDRNYRMIFKPYIIFNNTYGLFKIIEIKK